MARGTIGFWAIAATVCAAALGALYLLGVDEPTRKPWALLAVLPGIVAAELLTSRLGWKAPGDDPAGEPHRSTSFALRVLLMCLAALVGLLVLYSLTESAVAAWGAAVSLAGVLVSAFFAQLLARSP